MTDKRTLPRKESVIKQISKTKQENSRQEIVAKIKENQLTQSNKDLATPTHRKMKHISFDEYKTLLKKGDSVTDIIKTTSKHLVYFYNALLKGRITLTKEKFQKMYEKGMSLDEISKKEKIPREHITYLREFYGIKRKGATFQKRLKNEKPLSQKAKNIIIGSMLGDGHISKWGYFAEKHSPKQFNYLKWKASFLKPVTTDKSWSYYESIDKRSGTLIKTHCFRTITHSWIQEMEKLFYKKVNGRRVKVIPDEIEKFMNKEVLAVWFMDDGHTDWMYRNGEKQYKNTRPSASICTDSFSIEDLKKIKSILKTKFHLQCSMGKRNRLIFNADNTEKLLTALKPYATKNLLYKFCEHNYKSINNY